MPPKTKLFVGMLPPDCQEFTLRKLFERHGEVVECSVMGSYAFVHMKTEEEALSAIEALNQYDVNGYNISVEVGCSMRKYFISFKCLKTLQCYSKILLSKYLLFGQTLFCYYF